MNYLVCQPSFVGFLTAVYDSYYENKNTQGIVGDPNLCLLTDTFITSFEDVEKARKVRAGIIKKGGRHFYDNVADAYRSCNPDKERIIFEYLKLFFKCGKQIAEYFDNKDVIAFNDVLNKVRFELHRIPAFIRLQEMENGIFYGYYSSDNDLLEPVVRELMPRFNTMKFVVHDYKRRKMAFYDGETIHYSLAPEDIEITLSKEELFFQNIWKQYHNNVAIKERTNYKQQRAFAPKKYRHFMLEF